MHRLNKFERINDNYAKALVVATCMTYAVHSLLSVVTQRVLYGDTSWFLLRIVSESTVTTFYTNFINEFYYSRFFAFWYTQLPTLAALSLGVEDPELLSLILGCTFFTHKLLSIWICYALLPLGKKSLIVFPLLSVFAGTINSELYIVSESHLAISMFWPILIGMSFGEGRTFGYFALSSIVILLFGFTYESVAVLGPILCLVATYRFLHMKRNTRYGFILLFLISGFITVINWMAILYPRDPANKSAISSGLKNLLDDSVNQIALLHIGPTVSIIALAGVIAIIFLNRHIDKRWIMIGVITLSLTLILSPAFHFFLFAYKTNFSNSISDRMFSGLVLPCISVSLFLVEVFIKRILTSNNYFLIFMIVGSLAIGQTSFQIFATNSWSKAISDLRSTMGSSKGPIRCEDHLEWSGRQFEADSREILCHWWVMPLSIDLAPRWEVDSIVISTSVEKFQPFDPYNKEKLPRSEFLEIKYEKYIQALSKVKSITYNEPVSFARGELGVHMLKSGFSQPENWGTWTDARVSRLEICGIVLSANEELRLRFQVSPFLSQDHDNVTVQVAAANLLLATWEFDIGTGAGDRSISLDSNILSNDECVNLDFTITEPISPRELGLSDDPRNLGVAFVSLTAEKVR